MSRVLACLSVLSLLCGGPVLAADAEEPMPGMPVDSGWTFSVAPYFWMAGIKGKVGQFGAPPIEVDASFIDIIENFDIGGMAVGEARNGRFGVAFDVQYTKISAGAETRFDVLADRIELTSQTLATLVAGEYRVVETDRTTVDLLAGGRLWAVQTDIDPQGGPADGLFFSDSETWVDPIVGARARFGITDDVYATGWGMLGGFGAGSDLTWDIMAGIGYEVSDRISMIAGYRALSVDYTDDDFVFDVVQHGPLLGARISF